MAYHEVAMWEILSVLERLTRRESKAAITRATGHSRSTVRRYERVARELGWTPEGEAPTEVLAAALCQRLPRRKHPRHGIPGRRSGNPGHAKTDPRRSRSGG